MAGRQAMEDELDMGWDFARDLLFRTTLVLVAPLLLSSPTLSSDADQESSDSLVTRIDRDQYAIGGLRLNKRSQEITIPGWVNMDQGQIEYFATTRAGKTHEAVLVLDCRPLHLQTALLLLGLESGETNMQYQGDTTAPQGDSLTITVSWQDENGREVAHPAYELLYDLQRKGAMETTPWLFTGSMVIDGRFMADFDGSIIATYSDPVAVVNNPLSGRVDDTVYEANAEILPKPGTPVVMTISRWPQSEESRE